MSHTYLLSWDHTGLEACVNISDIDKEVMWQALNGDGSGNRGRTRSVDSIVNLIILRARFNTQRHYEVYCIDTDDTISEQDIRKMFEDEPQGSSDLIRARGRKLYSDRARPDEVKIR